MDDYRLNKKILNMICEMGFVIKDHEPDAILGSKRQSLIKKSHKHLIMVNFEYRKRIIRSLDDHRKKMRDEDPELLRQLEPKTF